MNERQGIEAVLSYSEPIYYLTSDGTYFEDYEAAETHEYGRRLEESPLVLYSTSPEDAELNPNNGETEGWKSWHE